MFILFNLYDLFLKLLPPMLRTDGIKAFIWALLSPLDYIITRFKDLVMGTEVRLSHNSFTMYLEKYLNGVFGTVDAIRVEDIIDDYSVYLSKKGEVMDYDIMTRKSEELDTLVLPSDKPGVLVGKFGVYIPSSLDTDENRRLIEYWVNYYKYTGTNFTIVVYE